jgi:anti-anti-sigma regulatory factor
MQQLVLDYIGHGLAHREKCIIAVPEYPPEFWTAGLQSIGVASRLLENGQLKIISPRHLYRGRDTDRAEQAMDAVCKSLRESCGESWKGVRVCTGFSHLLHDKDCFCTMCREERSVSEIGSHLPVTVLCTFDKSLLHQRVLNALLQCHPWSLDGGSLTRNPSYSNPGEGRIEVVSALLDAGVLQKPFVTLDFFGDIPVLCLGEKLDADRAADVRNLVEHLMDLGHVRLIADLSRTTSLDRDAVRTMLGIASALEERGGRLVIYDPLNPPGKMFQLIELSERIPVHLIPEDAENAARHSSL